jgi:hypothetical protein
MAKRTPESGAVDPGDAADLSVVLTRLMARAYRASEESRRALANDRVTRSFLEAGLSLIAEELGLGTVSAPTGRDDVPRPFFDWLSLNKVVDRARHDGPASLAMLRDRWPSRSDFIEDLMVYSLWSRQWEYHAAVARDAAARLTEYRDQVEAAEQLGYQVVAAFMNERAQRVAMLVEAAAGQDETIRWHRAELYRANHDYWQRFYRAAFDAWQIKLRPDVSLDDFGDIMTAVLEGLILRSISDPDAVIDHAAASSLFGKAGLMLGAGACDPGDGLSLSEEVKRRLLVRKRLNPTHDDAEHGES